MANGRPKVDAEHQHFCDACSKWFRGGVVAFLDLIFLDPSLHRFWKLLTAFCRSHCVYGITQLLVMVAFVMARLQVLLRVCFVNLRARDNDVGLPPCFCIVFKHP